MDRIPYGSGKNYTPEEWKNHIHQLQRNWRQKNPEKVKASNHKWALFYVQTKPFNCVCKFCGKPFKASRKYFIKCAECIQKSHENNIQRKADIRERKEAKKQKTQEIISLYQQGKTQLQISELFGVSQRAISGVLIRNGIRKNKLTSRARKSKMD